MINTKPKRLVVMVDDDIDFREAIYTMFKNSPVEVLGFDTGEEAVEFLADLNLHPDLIILDIELKVGRLSGVEIAYELRRKYGQEPPILFLSAEPTVAIWALHIPGSRALSKRNSLRKIYTEIMGKPSFNNSGLVDRSLSI